MYIMLVKMFLRTVIRNDDNAATTVKDSSPFNAHIKTTEQRSIILYVIR